MKTFSFPFNISLSSTFTVLAAALICLSANAQSGSINFITAETEIMAGDTFEVVVHIDPDFNLVSVVDLHMLFDPAYIEVLAVNPLLQSSAANVIQPEFDNASGTIDMGAFQLGAGIASTEFDMLSISFKALAPTPLTALAHPQSLFPKTIMAYAGENLLGAADDLEITITDSNVLSTTENSADGLKLDVWPNPTSDHGFVTISSVYSSQATLEIYDITGKVVDQVFRGTIAPGMQQRLEVNVSHFADGVYIFRLVTDHGNLNKRFVISK